MPNTKCCSHLDNMKPGDTMWVFKLKRQKGVRRGYSEYCCCDKCKAEIENTPQYKREKARKDWQQSTQQ